MAETVHDACLSKRPRSKRDDLPSESVLTELWTTFWNDRRREARNRLAIAYDYVIGEVIARLGPELRSHWEYGDLYGFGYIGLLEAIERFREGSPVGVFGGYVAQRVRGAILDELRNLDWLPRTLRDRANELRATSNRMTSENGAAPTPAALASAMGMTRDKSDEVIAAMHNVWVLSIDQMSAALGDVIVFTGEGPEAAVLRSLNEKALVNALADLPDRERAIVSLRYFEGRTQTEIGQMMGLTHSRICQLEAIAINRLRSSPSLQVGNRHRAAKPTRRLGERAEMLRSA